MGAGSQIGFEKSGASFDTIEAIAFTQLRPDHSADLPAYIGAAQSDTREQRLTIMGPRVMAASIPQPANSSSDSLDRRGLSPLGGRFQTSVKPRLSRAQH